MKQLQKWEQQIVDWNHIHGIKPSIERQRFFVNSEAQEYHNEQGTAKLLELGDWAFTAIYLHYLINKSGEDYHSSLIDCMNLVRSSGAEKFVDAVIASNWTKYVHSKYANIDMMSQEAVIVAEKYKGRYKQVVPVRSGDYYFIKGLEQDVNGEWHEKVLKPSTFKEAIHFIK